MSNNSKTIAMNQSQTNTKLYRKYSSTHMIAKLMEKQLVQVQRDELTKLQRLTRPLTKDERTYVVRLFQDQFGMKSTVKKPKQVEVTINSFEDLAKFNFAD